jgi:mono/diheme cytochrome c family protein
VTSNTFKSRLPILISVILLVGVTVLFLVEFVAASTTQPQGEVATLTATTYLDMVTPLMVNADAARGEILVNQTYECHVCHVTNAGQIAPSFVGMGQRASEERVPLTAEAYLYESIVYPTAYLVEGYSAAMPSNYPTRFSEGQLGDIIAYLLTQ